MTTLNFEFPWQDLLTPAAAAGAGAGGGRVRPAPAAAGNDAGGEHRAGPLPGPRARFPGGLAEFCQDLTLRVYNPCPVRSW